MSLVLGVDGGASKTVAVVVEAEGPAAGTVRGAGRAGNTDIYQTPEAVANVARAVAEAAGAAETATSALAAAALSLVGADWPEDMAFWRAALPRLGLAHLPPPRVAVVNDAVGALAAGAPEGPAVAVVCGTGCAVGARGADGTAWHTSFWQRRQGAVELADRALDAVWEAELGVGPPTALGAAALEHFGAASPEDLLHAFTARERPRPTGRGGFAARILDLAASGDVVARVLALDHAEALARYGLAAARRVGVGSGARLVLAGGVFRHPSGLMRGAIECRMAAALPGLDVVPDVPEPVAGAASIALGLLGGGPAAHRARLRASLPPPAFFHTGRPDGGARLC